MEKNILLVGYRDKSHSSAGGYDRIINNPNVDSLLGENVPFGFIPVSKRGKILNVFFLDLIARFKRFNYKVVHFFYGDTLLIPFIKLRHHKIVATIHMDIDDNKRFKKLFLYVLKHIDGVIVLSSNQQKKLKETYHIESVFIPHGFAKPVFKKVNMNIDDSKINVSILGQNYRDYRAIKEAVEFCLEYNRLVHFHLIGQSENFKNEIQSFANVTCYPRLSDDEYFSVLSSCDYNYLPVTFATANNALLEAQFLGIHSILPAIPGIMDYAAPKPLNLFYDSIKEMKKIFAGLRKKSYSKDLVLYSKRFEWDCVYEQLNAYYDYLIEKEK